MLAFLKKENHIVPVKETKNYNGIDLIKFICAIMVFMLHFPPFQGEIPEFGKYVNFGFQNFICRLAVPFFFASSGFFLFKKMSLYDLDIDRIKAYCYKILRLLGTWYVLLFFGGNSHLWYLGATVVAIILLSLCLSWRIKLGYIYAIACALYVIGLLGDSYYGIIAPLENISIFNAAFKGYELVFTSTRNGVFMGFIFVLTGAAISNCRFMLKARTALTGFVLSMLCLFAEVFLLKYNDIPIEYNMYVFLIPAVYFLFSFAVTVELKDRPVYMHLRKIGVMVYFSHFLMNKLTSSAIIVIDKICGTELLPYQFIFSLSLTLLVAIFADWLSYKDKFKWINWVL